MPPRQPPHPQNPHWPVPHPPCPLCHSCRCRPFAKKRFRWGLRRWLLCENCRLVFVPLGDHPSTQEERNEYDLHENSLDDPRYLSFLEQLKRPLVDCLPEAAQGLDFGCGPAPALAHLLGQAGFQTQVWDPIYFPDPSHLSRSYDFVTCTEVVEHFRQPSQEWARLKKLVAPGGILGVMTSQRDEAAEFLDWSYIRERTHLSLYSKTTIEWIKSRWNYSAVFANRRVLLLRSN